MKYQPSLPEHNDNVTPGNPLKEFVKLLAGLVVLVLVVFWALGLLVDAAVDRLSPAAEAHLHGLFSQAREHGRDKVIASPEADKTRAQEVRLQAMVDELSACTGLRLPTRVRLVKSDTANAVVFHGGNIVVMSGLVSTLQSENGLAFVLAHELGHITHRDHLRGMGRAIVLYALAGMLLGDASALSGILEPAIAVGQARHSRAREALADDAALRTLQCRYGHVGGATEFFESLKKTQGKATPVLHVVETHPDLQARIERTARIAREQGYRQGATTPLGDVWR